MAKPFPISDGALLLRRYLDARDSNVPAFCESHGLDRVAVQRAMNGDRENVSAKLAAAIEVATAGHDDAVPARTWGEFALNATIEDTKATRGKKSDEAA